MTGMSDSRLPEGWDEWVEHDLGDCARCGMEILAEDPTHIDVFRVAGMEMGGLAIQGVVVHAFCWRHRIGDDAIDWRASSPTSKAGWAEMVADMRVRIEEAREEDGWL